MAVLRLKQRPVTSLVRPPWLIPNNTYWQNVTITGDSFGSFVFPFLAPSGQGYEATDKAIAGATMTDVTGPNVLEGARLEADLDANPDATMVFILSAGVTDLDRVHSGAATTTLGDLQTGLQNCVAQIKARGMKVGLSNAQIATQWTDTPANGMPQLAYDYNAWLNNYCAENDIYLIPSETAFTTAGGDFTDGINLTDAANEELAQLVQQGIKTTKIRAFPRAYLAQSVGVPADARLEWNRGTQDNFDSFTFSGWFYFDPIQAGNFVTFISGANNTGAGERYTVQRDNDGKVRHSGNDSGGTPAQRFWTVDDEPPAAQEWIHIATSYEASTQTQQMYINGSSVSIVSSVNTTNLTQLRQRVGIFAQPITGNQQFLGHAGEIWWTTDFVDLSGGGINKFGELRGSTWNPVALGADGSTPTGSQPEIYLGADMTATDWNAGTNKGSAPLTKEGAGSFTDGPPV